MKHAWSWIALGTLSTLPAWAGNRIEVSVKGMVCSFCAQGIKKKFSAEEAVDQVDVRLENHRVALALKDGKNLDDQKISELLRDSGFAVESIDRK